MISLFTVAFGARDCWFKALRDCCSGITLRLNFGVVTTTANENGRALLWRDSLWKKRSEPGRNQEESGEKLLRKLMRSQVF